MHLAVESEVFGLPNGERGCVDAGLGICPTSTRVSIRSGRNGLLRPRVHNFHMTLCEQLAEATELEPRRSRLRPESCICGAVRAVLVPALPDAVDALACLPVAAREPVEEADNGFVCEQVHAMVSEVRRTKPDFDGIGTLDRTPRADVPSAVDHAIGQVCRVFEVRTPSAGSNAAVFTKPSGSGPVPIERVVEAGGGHMETRSVMGFALPMGFCAPFACAAATSASSTTHR